MAAWSQGWHKYADCVPLGTFPWERYNRWGGSVALGHPFAATGGRIIMSALRGLEETKGKRAIISICAAAGMACAMTLLRE